MQARETPAARPAKSAEFAVVTRKLRSPGSSRPSYGRLWWGGILAHGSSPLRIAFPEPGLKWHKMRGLAADSCGSSLGFPPKFPL